MNKKIFKKYEFINKKSLQHIIMNFDNKEAYISVKRNIEFDISKLESELKRKKESLEKLNKAMEENRKIPISDYKQ